MQKLNVQPPTLYARVSDHIPLIINFIEKLIHDGFAYACPSGKNDIFNLRKTSRRDFSRFGLFRYESLW